MNYKEFSKDFDNIASESDIDSFVSKYRWLFEIDVKEIKTDSHRAFDMFVLSGRYNHKEVLECIKLIQQYARCTHETEMCVGQNICCPFGLLYEIRRSK